MLCIIMTRMTAVISDGETVEHEWHIGEQVPDVPVEKISEIQADGDELAYIKDLFSSGTHSSILIPYGKKVARWDGCIARTIYLNLWSLRNGP